jgi:hypothetical protein
MVADPRLYVVTALRWRGFATYHSGKRIDVAGMSCDAFLVELAICATRVTLSGRQNYGQSAQDYALMGRSSP